MRSIVLTMSAFFLSSSAALAAEPAKQPLLVADAGELSPYDAGYAFQASVACPNVTLLFPMGTDAQANPEFKRGAAMFDHYVTLQKIEGACKAALSLYDEKTGKAAKMLGRK